MPQEVEVGEVDLVPGHDRVVLEGRFDIPSIDNRRFVDRLQTVLFGVANDDRPEIIGFPSYDGIGVLREPGQPERLVRHLGHMGAAHHNRHAGFASYGCRRSVSRLGHPRHEAHAHQVDLIVPYIPGKRVRPVRGRVRIQDGYPVLYRSEPLEHERPQVWHKVPGHLIVGGIEKNVHVL